MSTTAEPPSDSAPAEETPAPADGAPSNRSRWWRLGLAILAVSVVATLIVPPLLPPFAHGDPVEVEGSAVFDEASIGAEGGLSMNGYLAVTDNGTAVVERTSGEVTAQWFRDFREAGYSSDPEVVHIDADGAAVMVVDPYADRQTFVRVDGLDRTPLELEESFGEVQVAGTSPGAIVLSGCSNGQEVLAGYDPEDLSEIWRLAQPTTYCAVIGARDLRPSDYVVTDWGKGRTQRIIAAETGAVVEPKTTSTLMLGNSGVIYRDTALFLTSSSSVVAVDAATGEQRWERPGCPPSPSYTFAWSGLRSPYDSGLDSRVAMLTCGAGQDDAQAIIMDVEDGRRAPLMPEPSVTRQTYVSGEAPDYDEESTDDFERPVTPLLIGDVIVTRSGKRMAGTDVFTGEELWTRTLDLDESDVLEVQSAGPSDDAALLVSATGDSPGWLGTGVASQEHKTSVQVIDPRTGDLMISTRKTGIDLATNGPEALIVDEDDNDLYLIPGIT